MPVFWEAKASKVINECAMSLERPAHEIKIMLNQRITAQMSQKPPVVFDFEHPDKELSTFSLYFRPNVGYKFLVEERSDRSLFVHSAQVTK